MKIQDSSFIALLIVISYKTIDCRPREGDPKMTRLVKGLEKVIPNHISNFLEVSLVKSWSGQNSKYGVSTFGGLEPLHLAYLSPNSAKVFMICCIMTAWVWTMNMNFILSTGQGQGQFTLFTNCHDNQRSHLSGVPYVSWAILAIKVAEVAFVISPEVIFLPQSEGQVKGRSKPSNFEIIKSRHKKLEQFLLGNSMESFFLAATRRYSNLL